MSSKVKLPFGLNGIFTWLVFFGLTSISTFIVFYDVKLKKGYVKSLLISFIEIFLSNVSLLSRGFILNSTSLVVGVGFLLHPKELLQKKWDIVFVVGLYVTFFIFSVYGVNLLRSNYFNATHRGTSQILITDKAIRFANENTKFLFIDRWVGIEGVLAISSNPHLGWGLFKQAVAEKYNDSGTSFYDNNIAVNSPYVNRDLQDNHFISLPGVIAFFFYSGSFILVFVAIFVFGVLAAFLEWVTFYFSGGNLIFCSLIGQVIAYRYIHFGYVPRQSYLLFGTILINIFLFYFVDLILGIVKRRRVF